MSIFITSDEHSGHERILSLAARPFKSVEEMNETIIARHNKKVSPKGFTIHVGDMFWQTMSKMEARAILHRLHGRHAFIYGNHDELIEKYVNLRMEFDWVVGKNKASGSHIIKWNKHKITLNHYAQRVWDGSHKGHWHVYGHSHGALAGLGKSFDIGVDSHSFAPWSLEEIEQEMEKRTQHHTIDNTGAVGVDRVAECATCLEARVEARIKREILREVSRAGSTVHEAGCECGFCLMGGTRL